MPADRRAACIIGIARHTWHPSDAEVAVAGGAAPEPLDMWERVARDAAADSGGARPGALGDLEGMDVVYSQSWQYDDAIAAAVGSVGRLAGAPPIFGHRRFSPPCARRRRGA